MGLTGPFLLKPRAGVSLSCFELTLLIKEGAPHRWPLKGWFDYEVHTHPHTHSSPAPCKDRQEL